MSRQWAREQLVSLALRLEENELELMLDTVKSIAHQLQECNVDFMERLVSDFFFVYLFIFFKICPNFFLCVECSRNSYRYEEEVKRKKHHSFPRQNILFATLRVGSKFGNNG